jgi:hypothetical protein
MALLHDLVEKSKVMTGSSLFLYWFSHDLEELIQPLLSHKYVDIDVVGLLGLITFAGIDFNEEELLPNLKLSKKLLKTKCS